MSTSACVPSRQILTLLTLVAGFALPFAAFAETRVSQSYGKLPLHFEANQGQTHQEVRFLARGAGYSLYLTAGEAVLVLTKPNPDAKRDLRSTPERLGTQARGTPVVVRMSLVGAAPKPRVSGLDELPGKANYLIGKPAKWRTNVPTYAKVHYRAVYPGIDLVYYGNQRQLEYDFVVSPGADPGRIVLGFQGAERLEINAEGELVLHAAGGAIRQRVPVIYQEIDGVRTKIEGRYVLKDAHRVGFQVAAHDPSRPLVIDPTLVYSTYLGGSSGEHGAGIAVDAAGAAYVTGTTGSTDFPTTPGAIQTTYGGGGSYPFHEGDAFVTKLNAAGTALVYSTYLGGSSRDVASGIAVDAAGAAYVTGYTASTDFTAGCTAPCTVLNGSLGGFRDAFVTKINAAGAALVYSTYLGGSGSEDGDGIAVDTAGAAYVTGWTNSPDLTASCTAPCTVLNGTFGGWSDAFVTKINAAGTALVYSTYLGGSGFDGASGIAVDAAGAAYVTGLTTSTDFTAGCTAPCTVLNGSLGGFEDAFVTKLNPAGTALVYSTYLGVGTSGDGIAVDAAGAAYVAGQTGDFTAGCTAPCTVLGTYGGFGDAFVTKINAAGTALVYFTYLGGSSVDAGGPIAVDAAGAAYVTGTTWSTDFTAGCTAPCTVLDATLNGVRDAFVAKIADIMSRTPGTVSLGGFIDSAGTGGKATFGGSVQFQSGDPSPTGSVRYLDHVTCDDIKATSFDTLVIGAGPCGPDTHAVIIGKATVNGVPDQDLQVKLDNCSEPGSPQPSTPGMLMIVTGPNQVYVNRGPLAGGDIQVEKAQ